MKKRMMLAAVVAAILAMSGLLPAGTCAAPKDREKKKTVTGVVKSVNAGANTLVVVSKDREIEFQVVPRALIVINSKLARLVDVKKNADAKVTYTLDRENHIEAASEIWATQPITQFIQQHGKQETRPKK